MVYMNVLSAAGPCMNEVLCCQVEISDFQWPVSLQLISVLFHSFFTFTMITTNHANKLVTENLLFIHTRNYSREAAHKFDSHTYCLVWHMGMRLQ